MPRDPTRRVTAHQTSDTVATYNIPSLKMAALDPEPFGEPTLLLSGSSLLSGMDDATTFTSNGLLDTGLFGGSGDGDGGEDAFSAQSSSWAARPEGTGSSDEDELSAFTTNGLLDGPTPMTSTLLSF